MKTYVRPKSKSVNIDLESSILGGSNANTINVDQSGEYYDAVESYSNKKDGLWNTEWSE